MSLLKAIQVGPVTTSMDKIIVLAPPTKRKHPAPPPAKQQTSPATAQETNSFYSRTKRKEETSMLEFAANKPSKWAALLYSRTKWKKETKARTPALLYIQILHPCSFADKHSTLPKKRATWLLSKRAKRRNKSFSLPNHLLFLCLCLLCILVNHNKNWCVVCSPEQSIYNYSTGVHC